MNIEQLKEKQKHVKRDMKDGAAMVSKLSHEAIDKCVPNARPSMNVIWHANAT